MKATLILNVEYDDEDANPGAAKDMLVDLVYRAEKEGLFTGNTEMTVEKLTMQVIIHQEGV